MLSHGLCSVCFRPKEILPSSFWIDKTIASTSSPLLTTSLGSTTF
ncbi:hypothetical protein CP061683_0747A, partial [Chlamydia psittaci 06-1683]